MMPQTHTEPARSGFDHLADVIAHSRASVRHMADGHSEVADLTTRLTQDMAETMAASFEQIARARSPLDAAGAYADFLLVVVRRSLSQMSELNAVLLRAHANLMTPFVGSSAASPPDGIVH